MVWVIVVLVLAVGADRCPSLTCSNITMGLCAEATSAYSLVVNTQACPAYSYCSLKLLYRWANATLGTGGFACESAETFNAGEFLMGFDPMSPCGLQESGKDLAEGYAPKVCQSDADCLLQDGTLSSCTCGANGLAYCVPHLSSRVYAEEWTECERNGGVLESNRRAWWMAKYSLYPLQQRPVVCVEQLFYEFKYLEAAESAVSAGLWLSLPLLFLN